MKLLKSKQGLTLVEIIISIAILGIVAVAFLGMFTVGFKGIMTAGRNSQAGYIGQRAMENRIVDIEVTETNVTIIPETEKTLTINFEGVADPVEVDGKIQRIHFDDTHYELDYATFIPE
jgi:prepilin-type N-terminal cleavage/methylation domain-containing protein